MLWRGPFVDDSCYIAWWRIGCSVNNRINVAHTFACAFLFFFGICTLWFVSVDLVEVFFGYDLKWIGFM